MLLKEAFEAFGGVCRSFPRDTTGLTETRTSVTFSAQILKATSYRKDDTVTLRSSQDSGSAGKPEQAGKGGTSAQPKRRAPRLWLCFRSCKRDRRFTDLTLALASRAPRSEQSSKRITGTNPLEPKRSAP